MPPISQTATTVEHTPCAVVAVQTAPGRPFLRPRPPLSTW